jgi:uncharacterized membrane-anchored protein
MSGSSTRILTVLGTVLVLGAVNASIAGKERIIRGGEVVYLDLAPVDPRSLMQGDYLALRFRLADAIEAARSIGIIDARARRVALTVDDRRVATLDPNASAPLQIGFRIHNGSVWLGTNAYFFTEGTASRYARAHYGEFRLDRDSGEAVLVGLRDESLNAL